MINEVGKHQSCMLSLFAQTPDIKSYSRMRNKMFSADDHRFRPSPRPESNVDINRVLAVAKDPESMIKAAQALSDASNGVAKQKNGFGLPEETAAAQFHLRLLMISMVFEMPSERVRVQIIRHARTHSVGKYQSCMF